MRVTCDNKGGVLICVPSQLNPTKMHRFATSGIEAVSATVQLPNGENLQIALVYRSPSVPQTTFITLLTRLLTHVTLCTTPCVILGDFNEDNLHCQDSAILSLMSNFSFTQIVCCTTTPQTTLIDHVYLRSTVGSIIFPIVQVQDTYYSHYDTVYCSIPL